MGLRGRPYCYDPRPCAPSLPTASDNRVATGRLSSSTTPKTNAHFNPCALSTYCRPKSATVVGAGLAGSSATVGAAGSGLAAWVVADSRARQLPLSQTTTVMVELLACSWFHSQATACCVTAVPSTKAANTMMDFI